ncbi:putative epidermal cell surface receptor isoform X2 [Cephus cinctus]|uniref:Epidermal cell surface receptor isoform X2 n=1 Tax=Cephus cinctus TaxID=211228 RepID=A0AAJ7C042_CEPCN|nr:putative epidermal cell surface receptor isoform X2 [Cephus cinctus]
MRSQERWFLLAVVGLCLLGGVVVSSPGDLDVTTTSPADEEVPGVEPLQTESDSNPSQKEVVANYGKNEFPTKENDSKSSADGKKKSIVDFKPKTDLKYQKTLKDEVNNDEVASPVSGMESVTNHPVESSTALMNDNDTKKIIDQELLTNLTEHAVPFLIHGEPMMGPVVGDVYQLPAMKNEMKMNSTMESNSEKNTTMADEVVAARGRALNVTAVEPTNSLHANLTDLSDVSMDEEDKEVEGGEYVVAHNESNINVTSTLIPNVPMCIDGNHTYAIGEKIVRDCEEKCMCGEGGRIMNCEPLCISPLIRAGKVIDDPWCAAITMTEEPCCAIIVCAESSAPEPEESCIFGNETLTRGQRVEDGCSRVCVCEAGGSLKCQPRCPPNETTSAANQHDRCVALPDPRDSCCTITLCDVTLGDHEIKPESPAELFVNLTDVKVLNSTAIKLKLSTKSAEDVNVELSADNLVWRQQKPDKDGIVSNLEPAHTYYVRITEAGKSGPALQVFLPAEVIKTNITEKVDKNTCSYRGKSYKIGAEWYDECISFCTCNNGANVECHTIECPTDFGLDVLDPHCLDWETVPSDFIPKAPQCCPQEVRCRNNGSCLYEGTIYENWSDIPTNVTGCEKKCYCEMGNVTCHAACPPVMALPPPNLECPPHHALLAHLPDEECCLHWVCGSPSLSTSGKNVTSTFPGPLATETIDQQLIDDSKRPNNKSAMLRPTQEPERGTSFPWEDPENINSYPDTSNHELHYPINPGHPTVPYNGPYSPNYKPTQPSVEQLFHLPSHPEKMAPPLKDKSKSKADSKKAVESIKPHKEVIEQQFQGPFAPDKLADRPQTNNQVHSNIRDNPLMPGTVNPNELPPSQKGGHVADEPQFIPLNSQPGSSGPPFVFSPNNGEHIPPTRFDVQYQNHEAGPPYSGPVPLRPNLNDPNFIVPISPKKKISIADHFVDENKSKPPLILPGKSKPGQRNPDEEILPEDLYHLINLQHPGLIQLGQSPPQGHQGLYDLHQQISSQKNLPNNQVPPGYFGPPPPGPKKPIKPQIFTQKNENGETTYHIHTPEIPNSPQQFEELLAHISQHDSNPGPFQHYPEQPAITHNLPNGPPPPLPSHIDAHIPHTGLTHLNHLFAAQTPNQSGLEHNVPPNFGLPGGIPSFSGHPAQSPSDEVSVQTLEALDENTVRLVFTVPSLLVGLHGRVELRYTSDKANLDVSTWKSQIFAPPNDLIATAQMEFELGDLKPSTEYKVKITVKLRDLSNNPSSKVYSVRTLERPAEITTLPSQIPINAELALTETNSTWVNVMWKKFTDYELQFIDGVQLRYKEHDGKVYAATPLIHRAVTSYVIENLKPSTTYEIGIYFIPFPGQTTELISEKTIQITTSMEPDPYSFDVKVDIKTIKSTDVEVSWSGVPYPEDKYVNIYRAIYQSDTGKEDTSTFKIAKRDSPAKTIINDLKPGTRYRLWIEVYLTNGRIKKSNVQDFVTKPGVLLSAGVSQQGKLASIPLHEGDYYGPLVIVAVVASLAILSTLILLMMLMKRRTSSKADISPRKTTSAYDNPSYKVEMQQETMDL